MKMQDRTVGWFLVAYAMPVNRYHRRFIAHMIIERMKVQLLIAIVDAREAHLSFNSQVWEDIREARFFKTA